MEYLKNVWSWTKNFWNAMWYDIETPGKAWITGCFIIGFGVMFATGFFYAWPLIFGIGLACYGAIGALYKVT